MLDHASTDTVSNNKQIDYDIFNIVIYYLSSKPESFQLHLLETQLVVITAILDGNIYPQSKRDAFKIKYISTMNCIYSYYYW